jgi:hypothetical protein
LQLDTQGVEESDHVRVISDPVAAKGARFSRVRRCGGSLRRFEDLAAQSSHSLVKAVYVEGVVVGEV